MKPISMTISAFCRASGLGKTTTYGLIAEGRLKAVKVGRRTLITMASAEALVAGENQPPVQEEM